MTGVAAGLSRTDKDAEQESANNEQRNAVSEMRSPLSWIRAGFS